MVPSAVQTGCWNGCSESAQKLKGSRLKLAPAPLLAPLRAFAPADAPNASSLDHSLWVIYDVVLVWPSFRVASFGDIRTACRCLLNVSDVPVALNAVVTNLYP